MNKKLTIILSIVILSMLFCMPVFANSNVVSTGTNATSLRNPSGTQGRSSDLKQTQTTNPGNTSILNSSRNESAVSSSSSSQTQNQTSLNKDNSTTVSNKPTESSTTTVASSTNLPKAGLSPIIYIAVPGIVLLAAFLYKKVVKFNI